MFSCYFFWLYCIYVCIFVIYIQFSLPYCLFVSNSQVIRCENRLRNDLYSVGWGVELCSIQSYSSHYWSLLSPWFTCPELVCLIKIKSAGSNSFIDLLMWLIQLLWVDVCCNSGWERRSWIVTLHFLRFLTWANICIRLQVVWYCPMFPTFMGSSQW